MKTTIIALLAALLTAGATLAEPTHPTFGTFVNSGAVPNGANLVLNITYKVVNDEDSGFVGYWALDSYNKHVQVWQDPIDKTLFYAVVRYAGQWTTYAGALSPGFGVLQTSDGSGTFEGGYVATFNATAFTPASGKIASVDLGGTVEDILDGTYGDQTGNPPGSFDWLSTYFTEVSPSTFNEPQWGWTYHYKGQTWNNYYYGSQATDGDIVTSSH